MMEKALIIVLLLIAKTRSITASCSVHEVKSTVAQRQKYYDQNAFFNKWKCCRDVYPTLYKYVECTQVNLVEGHELHFNGAGSEETFKYITFEASDLPSLPHGVFPSITLDQLNLNNCSIKTIQPGAFAQLNSLKRLNLQDNKILNVFKGTYNSLSYLQVLDLSNNNVQMIEENGLLGLVSLETVFLNRNALESLASNTFHGLKNLQIINLSDNQISAIKKDVFTGLTKLGDLDLAFNKLTRFDSSIVLNTKQIGSLILSHNSISKIETIPESLLVLDLSWNNISELNPSLFSKSKELVSLSLNDNFIKSLTENSFVGLLNLKYLYFQNNQITKFPIGCFSNLHELRELSFSGNAIDELDFGTWNGLTSLEILDVSSNQLNSLSENSFYILTNLKELIINNNFINYLDVSDLLKHLKKLKNISLGNNEWTCPFLVKALSAFKEANVDVSKGSIEHTKNVHGILCKTYESTKSFTFEPTEDTPTTRVSELKKFLNEDFLNSSFYKYFSTFQNVSEQDYKNPIFSRYFQDDFKNTTFYKYFQNDFANTSFSKDINASFSGLFQHFRQFNENFENSAFYEFFNSNKTFLENLEGEFRKYMDESYKNSEELKSLLKSMKNYFEDDFKNSTFYNFFEQHYVKPVEPEKLFVDAQKYSDEAHTASETKVSNVLLGCGVMLLAVIAILQILNSIRSYLTKMGHGKYTRRMDSECKIINDTDVELM